MAGSKSNLYTCLWLMYLLTSCNSRESHCSKFPCEEALLEKLVRLEFKVGQMDNDTKAVQDDFQENLNKLKKQIEDKVASKKQLEAQMGENADKMLPGFPDAWNIWFRARDVSNLEPSKDETMVYTNVMANRGSAYISSNGIFTVPIAGLYLFSAQFCIETDRYFSFAFYVDGIKEQASSIASPRNDCITNMMLIELRKSSEVSVKSISGGNRLITFSNRWNIFSGALIKRA